MSNNAQRIANLEKLAFYFAEKGYIPEAREYTTDPDRPILLSAVRRIFRSYARACAMVRAKYDLEDMGMDDVDLSTVTEEIAEKARASKAKEQAKIEAAKKAVALSKELAAKKVEHKAELKEAASELSAEYLETVATGEKPTKVDPLKALQEAFGEADEFEDED
jgi:hypothetical protein